MPYTNFLTFAVQIYSMYLARAIFISFLIINLIIVSSCEKRDNSIVHIPGNGVTDIEGNNYSTVIIGDQEWMSENLKTNLYCNGESIPNSGDSIYITVYKNNPSNAEVYGKLYNYQAVTDSTGICPCGWEIPTELDYAKLIDYLGGYKNAMKKMKSEGFLEDGSGLWSKREPENVFEGNNLSGFNAVPGGLGFYNNFLYKDTAATFWAIPISGNNVLRYQIRNAYVGKQAYTDPQAKEVFYFSVRCIKSIEEK